MSLTGFITRVGSTATFRASGPVLRACASARCAPGDMGDAIGLAGATFAGLEYTTRQRWSLRYDNCYTFASLVETDALRSMGEQVPLGHQFLPPVFFVKTVSYVLLSSLALPVPGGE